MFVVVVSWPISKYELRFLAINSGERSGLK